MMISNALFLAGLILLFVSALAERLIEFRSTKLQGQVPGDTVDGAIGSAAEGSPGWARSAIMVCVLGMVAGVVLIVASRF